MQSKPWYQSRTVILNCVIAIIAIIGLLLNMPEFKEYTPYMVLVTNILNVMIRVFLTSQPIEGGQK